MKAGRFDIPGMLTMKLYTAKKGTVISMVGVMADDCKYISIQIDKPT